MLLRSDPLCSSAGTLVEHGPQLPEDLYDDVLTSSLKFLHLPMPDGSPPSLEQTRQYILECRHCIKNGGAISVHCWAGMCSSLPMAASD